MSNYLDNENGSRLSSPPDFLFEILPRQDSHKKFSKEWKCTKGGRRKKYFKQKMIALSRLPATKSYKWSSISARQQKEGDCVMCMWEQVHLLECFEKCSARVMVKQSELKWSEGGGRIRRRRRNWTMGRWKWWRRRRRWSRGKKQFVQIFLVPCLIVAAHNVLHDRN